LTIFLVALSHKVYENHQTKISDFIAIKVFLLAGTVAMVLFGNLAMFFLGIEVLSIALYILAASNRLSVKVTAGLKYFLMGSLLGFILFGICLIYTEQWEHLMLRNKRCLVLQNCQFGSNWYIT
jgi:NADH-quinone oxidoreductase subunit N